MRCNHCTLRGIRRHAETVGGTVETRPKPTDYAPDGVDVYVKYPNDNSPIWAAWLMKLPEHCVC